MAPIQSNALRRNRKGQFSDESIELDGGQPGKQAKGRKQQGGLSS